MNEAVKKLQQMCDLAGSQKAVADELGITPAYLGDILHERREVSDRIANLLGFEWQLVSVNPFPHPADSTSYPNLVERKLVEHG